MTISKPINKFNGRTYYFETELLLCFYNNTILFYLLDFIYNNKINVINKFCNSFIKFLSV